MGIDNGNKLEQSIQVSPGFSRNNLLLQGGATMKRVFLACVAVMFLFGISSVSFASGTGDEMKGKAGTTKEEGKKKV